MKRGLLSVWCIIIWSSVYCQEQVIQLNNGSFEEVPHKGGDGLVGIRGWYDCSELQFPSETPPDIHPINAWKVTTPPSDGKTYLGMVVRDNDSWESISQRLRQPLQEGQCYSFSIDLSRSDNYVSGSRVTQRIENYTEPTVLRIWGGTGVCGHHELLAESSVVKSLEWTRFEFEFQPGRDVNYFTLEAFYEVPVLIPYNGHLLLDNASDITRIPCPGDDPWQAEEIAVVEPTTEPSRPAAGPSASPVEKPAPNITKEKPAAKVTKTRLLQELDANTLRKGQTIRIEHLYFAANSDSINQDASFDVLDEVFDFLAENRNIVVEIGGHTNTIPRKRDCQVLSNKRAKRVALYLVRKGISPKRIRYRGYGKSQPIVKNDKFDMAARQKNQRVEIKILSLNYRDTGSTTKPSDSKSVQKSG